MVGIMTQKSCFFQDPIKNQAPSNGLLLWDGNQPFLRNKIFSKIEKVIRFPQSEILEAKDLVITDFLINRNFEITIF